MTQLGREKRTVQVPEPVRQPIQVPQPAQQPATPERELVPSK